MYVSMKTLLNEANQHNYAVLAINCFNLETATAVIKAAEEMKSPIIVNLLQEHMEYHISFKYLTKAIIQLAHDSTAKIAINLDHGTDVAFVKQCLNEGFSGVMIDASKHSLKENIKITNDIVAFAQLYGAGVEAEVGTLTNVNDLSRTDDRFTNPEEAIEFINSTGIDCLAISFGSEHGIYNHIPEFRFDIVEKIKEATKLPLVLHGGSGSGDENIRKAVQLGINKINIGSDFMKAQIQQIEMDINAKESDYVKLIHNTMDAGKQVIKEYIELAGSKNMTN